MIRLFKDLLYLIKKPLLILLGFVLLFTILERGIICGILISDEYSEQKSQDKRSAAYISDTKLDLSEYIEIHSLSNDLGAAFLQKLYEEPLTDQGLDPELINIDVLAYYGYDLDEAAFHEQINAFFELYPPSIYDLLIYSVSDTLKSGGRIYNVYLAKEDSTSSEYQYDLQNMFMFSFTVYFKMGEPKTFLPFAEPLIDSYADSFGLKKK